MNKKGFREFLILLFLFLLLTQSPAFLGMIFSGDNYQFGGFLLNPLDGNSYLAKMRQGWNGNWDFHLPFTADRGKGAYLFGFYILLGHIARWFHLDLVVTFHVFRFLCSVFMAVMIYRYFLHDFQSRYSLLSFSWVLLGGGLGGLVIPLDLLTPDFWVAEGYPFLAAYTNPHFPLSIALMLWLLNVDDEKPTANWFEWVLIFILSVILSNISPFAVVLTLLIYGAKVFMGIWEKNKIHIKLYTLRGFILCLGSLPFMLYQTWVVRVNPELYLWNLQNQTPSPSIILLIIGLSPVLLWAMATLFFVSPKRWIKETWIQWVFVAVIALYLPFSLQRRFMIGLYIPLGVGAAKGFQVLQQKYQAKKLLPFMFKLSFGLSLLTNIVLIFAGFNTLMKFDRKIFLTRYESEAYHWMRNNLSLDSLILAGEQSGLLIPAWSGQRVIYGHPYESVEANNNKEIVNAFFSGMLDIDAQADLLCNHKIDYILWGYREREIYVEPPAVLILPGFTKLIFANRDVSIYQVLSDSICNGG